MQARPWLGLDHVNKTPKRSRVGNYLEKTIKIYNWSQLGFLLGNFFNMTRCPMCFLKWKICPFFSASHRSWCYDNVRESDLLFCLQILLFWDCFSLFKLTECFHWFISIVYCQFSFHLIHIRRRQNSLTGISDHFTNSTWLSYVCSNMNQILSYCWKIH